MTPEEGASPAFQAYLRARTAVLRMKEEGATGRDASAYWTEELENIDYLIEASPLVVRKLRHHAFHITGIRPYDYRDKDDGRRENFEARLRALRALGGDSLIVPESPALGGFGFEIDGRLFNVDTLKFYEVLIGMQRSGVLGALHERERPVVCEIGAGWGGFGYQLKTLFPGTTYVIVDFPELFLFSATYLATLFPDARLLFCAGPDETALDGWRDADFVFVPNSRAPLVSSLPLDLTVNMVSFQEMTGAQVRGYARMAAAAGCPWIYSLNRERSPYNAELVSVSEALADAYALADVPVLETDYTSALRKPPRANKAVERSALGYRHQVGRLPRAPARLSPSTGAPSPRVVLGMTLYNQAGHLREAIDSLLAQTAGDFRLVLLDDASVDETESIAREYEQRDTRVRYFRHDRRLAMVATWHEVAEIAARDCPSAVYFAWVSDHDRWHPRWLERLVEVLDGAPDAVLAYPITRRIGSDGEELDKGPRLFDTVAAGSSRRARWAHFCRHGSGAGDMVYGLMRLDALRRAGIFRRVLRPDRLLVAELTLQGTIHQVPEVLWFRRHAGEGSVARQHQTLVVAGEEPRWFSAPPWFQHAVVLWREYAAPAPRPLPISRAEWVWMLLYYQTTYGWRHFRKTETSHAIGRGIDGGILLKKRVKRAYHLSVYHVLVEGRRLWGKARRLTRLAVYHALVAWRRLRTAVRPRPRTRPTTARGARGETRTP